MSSKKSALKLAWVLLPMLAWSGHAFAQELWTARGGSATLTFDADALARLGLAVSSEAASKSPANGPSVRLICDPRSTLTFSVRDGSLEEFAGGDLAYLGSFDIRSTGGAYSLTRLTLARMLAPSLDVRWVLRDANAMQALVLGRCKTGFDSTRRVLTLHSPDVAISPSLAEALGAPSCADRVIGKLTVRVQAEWAGGWQPVAEQPVADGGSPRASVGPDMTFCQLYQLAQYGRLGDIVGLAVATTSWNIGNKDLMWFASPGEQHPFIVMNLFRLKADRFEQIGLSDIKHGFYALGNIQCGGTCTYEPGHSQGNWLGMGCTDTYSSSLNASQTGMAPRYEANPWTGVWHYAGSHFSQGSHVHNQIKHRLQVHDADLDPAQNAGATYYCEGYYAILDDVDVMNSASWKPVTVSGAPGGTWTFGMSGSSTRPTNGFAIDAWTGTTHTMLAQEVPPVEFVSPDGRCVLAAKTTDLGGGVWHYEYAVLNIDMDRKVKSFGIPVAPWVAVSNIGFHAVDSHDEPFSNTPWTAASAGGILTWSTVANPLRWGTLYNFRFDAAAAPVSGVTVTLGMYEPGTPTAVSGLTVGPDSTLSGNALRGGLLWDEWWVESGAPTPTGTHPLYPPGGQQSGSTTYRCKECHGWDYKGVDGAYGSGPHYTGIRGVYGSTLTAAEKFELVKNSAGPNGHAFADYGMTDADVLDLVQFMQSLVIDTDAYIDSAGLFLGDPVQGQANFTTGGWISCSACHGDDGATINFGTPETPEWVGTVAVNNPWELLHKTRVGQPGSFMPSWLDWGGTDQAAADLGRYCQLSLPVDCLTNAHCAAGDPCNHVRMCQGGHCVASTLDGDLNSDGLANGEDIPIFVTATMAGSADPNECAHVDFSGNGLVDGDDVPCMVSTLLTP